MKITDLHRVSQVARIIFEHSKILKEEGEYHIYKEADSKRPWVKEKSVKQINNAAYVIMHNILEENGYKQHHTAFTPGYISAIDGDYIKPYKGRFGEGYTLHTQSTETNRYHLITYYIKEVQS